MLGNKTTQEITWDNQYALITGASQGLGKAFAIECARRGLNLALVALPHQGLEQTAQGIALTYGVRATCLEIDLTAPGSPADVAHWVAENALDVAVLINNAGVGYNSRFEDSTPRENETCILLNNLALVMLSRLLLPQLKVQPRAYILNVASLAAYFPMPYMPVYAPSKAFTLSFSLALRQEMQGSNVSVSVLCPNGIRTSADAREKIAAGGAVANLVCMDAEDVARAGVNGLLRGKDVIVPGWLNRLISTVAHYTPRSLVNAVITAFWGKTARRGEAEPVATRGNSTELTGELVGVRGNS